MGSDFNPARAVLAVATMGTSEVAIHTAQAFGKVLPLPTTCCGCPTNDHVSISNNCYHCKGCGSHCGHIGTIGGYCFLCEKALSF